MKRNRASQFLLPGLLATALMAHAQGNPVFNAPEAQGKAVHFDDASTTARLVLQARGEGVQIYTCAQAPDWVWKLKAPDATLFDAKHRAIGKHFAGPTWRLEDGSAVVGKLLESRPQAGSVAWLILAAHSTGSAGKLSQVDVVRRTDTQGGIAPSAGCDAQHADGEVRVPYTATYSFFDTKD